MYLFHAASGLLNFKWPTHEFRDRYFFIFSCTRDHGSNDWRSLYLTRWFIIPVQRLKSEHGSEVSKYKVSTKQWWKMQKRGVLVVEVERGATVESIRQCCSNSGRKEPSWRHWSIEKSGQTTGKVSLTTWFLIYNTQEIRMQKEIWPKNLGFNQQIYLPVIAHMRCAEFTALLMSMVFCFAFVLSIAPFTTCWWFLVVEDAQETTSLHWLRVVVSCNAMLWGSVCFLHAQSNFTFFESWIIFFRFCQHNGWLGFQLRGFFWEYKFSCKIRAVRVLFTHIAVFSEENWNEIESSPYQWV